LAKELRPMALQAFSKIDIDGSGALSKDELKKALDHMGKNMTD
jgi:Ca2+-binding EF-hand superfamily protein